MRARAVWALLLGALIIGAAGEPAHARSGAKLGPFLKRLAAEFDRTGDIGTRRLAEGRRMKVRRSARGLLVPVILEPEVGSSPGQIELSPVRALGGEVDATSASFVRVLVPVRKVRLLEGLPGVRHARAPTPAIELGGLGGNVSESVSLTGAADLQAAGIGGAGIDVAVVDLGFIGLTSAIAAGELPSDTVVVDLPGSNDNPIESDTAHGVGVAEHAMDMAPDARLHCIKVGDEVDLENAADYLRDQGVEIANHSVGWVLASYYDDTGPINGTINRSHDTDGVFWTVAAGNDAEFHWRGGWSDPDADDWLNFSGGDERMDLTSSSSVVSLFLNWDQYGNSVTDLDLYVRDRRNRIVARSENWQTGTEDPVEWVSFFYRASRAPYRVQVHLWSGPTAGLDMTIFSFYNRLEYAVAASSLMDPANAHGAYSVAAIDQADWTLPDPPQEPYSSQGPTNDGRLKPDIAAPDGTTSWTYGVEASFGTSFSSPTVAGAAALVLEGDPLLTPVDVGAALSAMASDVGAPGPDTVFGAGELHLDAPAGCTAGDPCDDGDACTTADTCQGGACVGTPLVCDDGSACTADSCDPATGCVYTAVGCSDGNPCTEDLCDPIAGCFFPNNAAPCSDGNACTTGDICSGGICTPDGPTDCDDASVCTSDSCDPASGCVNAPIECSDGTFCNGLETCDPVSGCQAAAAVDCDDGVGCTVDSCNEASASCDHVPDHAACDDSLFCNGAETCDATADCQAGVPPACTEPTPTCDEATDSCVAGAADTVTVSKAQYKVSKSELKVEATSTGAPDVSLSVSYTADSVPQGPYAMDYDAKKNRYKMRVKPVPLPDGPVVTVTSTGGDSVVKGVQLQ